MSARENRVMFFGRRKHAAPASAVPAAIPPQPAAQPATQLSDELIFAAVQQTLAEAFGDGGWTVARRDPGQTDAIFHEVLVHSLATAVTARLSAVRDAAAPDAESAAPPRGELDGPLGLLRAPRIPAPASDAEAAGRDDDESAALTWEPAPITRWADLKRPVTGPVAVIEAPAPASEDKAA